MFSHSESKDPTHHEQLMNRVQALITADEDKKIFKPVIGALKEGSYDRAARKLCVSRHPLVIPILRILLEKRFLLKISFDTLNTENKSALDYAKKHNIEAYNLIMSTIKNDLTQLATDNFNSMTQSQAFPSNASQFTVEQQEVTRNAMETLRQQFASLTAGGGQNVSSHLLTQQFLSVLSPYIQQAQRVFPQQGEEPAIRPSETFHDALIRISEGNSKVERFITLCDEEKYDQALWEATRCEKQDEGKMGLMLAALLQRQSKLKVNSIKNDLNQTPLHIAAIKENWSVYYVLGGHMVKNNEDVEQAKDCYGKHARDYRREKQLGKTPSALLTELMNAAIPTGQQAEAKSTAPGPFAKK